MNKILLSLLALILAACASPQVTDSHFAEVTVTSPPSTATIIPTPTLHPQFVELQSQIAASGETFTLLSDGTLEQMTEGGAVTVPGLFVDKNGVMNLQVGNETVTLSPEDVSFDDKNGVNVEGYNFDETTGKWVEARELVMKPSGVGFELGAQIEGQPEGVREVADIVPPNVWDDEKKADYEERIDPTTYGFAQGETRLVYIPTEDGKGRVELQRTSNPTDVIAVFGSSDFVWKISEMVDENGDPVFLNAGVIVEMRGGVPVSISSPAGLANDFLELRNLDAPTHYGYIFVSRDGTRAVQFNFVPTGDGEDSKGYVYFRDEDGRTVRYIYVEDFDERPSFVRRLTR